MDIHPAIYLDYNATTPVAPEVVNEMLPYFLTAYGNPASNDHILGWQAQEAVETARASLADLLGTGAEKLIYTSGATEAINLALYGLFSKKDKSPQHLITLKTEHKAVLETCAELETQGVEVTYLPVKANGLVDLDMLADSITTHTKLVCIMMINNETGVMQPIAEIAKICHSQEVLFMSDTTQAIGKYTLTPDTQGIDILVGSAHKFYGPMGVGFLYLAADLRKDITPLITGGRQEGKKRAGSLNVPGIMGMAMALKLATSDNQEEKARIGKLRDSFEHKLNSMLSIDISGKNAPRVYNTSSICFHGVDAEKLMQAIGARVSASRGSACTSTRIEPSHVLLAMGLSEDDALSSVRFSLGRYTTEHELETAIELIVNAVNRLKIS